MSTGTGQAKQKKKKESIQPYGDVLDTIHLGITSEEELDRLLALYCPLSGLGADEGQGLVP